jgi:hypothetical protein
MDLRPGPGVRDVLMPNSMNISALSGFAPDGNSAFEIYVEFIHAFPDDLVNAVYSEVVQAQANKFFQQIYDY